MQKELSLKVLSPENIAFSGTISSVRIPASLGETEIFLNHMPFVSALLPGFVVIKENSADKNNDHHYFISDGYVEVNNNSVTLIVDNIIEASHTDKDFFQQKISQLSEKLTHNLSDHQHEKITASIARYQQYALQ